MVKDSLIMTVVRCSPSEVYEVFLVFMHCEINHVENLNSRFNPDIVVSIVGNRHN
jgi:hypothetical protein